LRYLVAILVLFCSYIPSIGQVLIGRVTDKETGEGLYPVSVTNLSTRYSVLTDKDGNYSIEAKAGEFVAFTLMGYKAQQKTIPYSIGTAEVYITLQSISYVLDEAEIKALTKYQKDSIYRKETYQRPLAAKHAGIMSPFSVLAEQFSQKSKRTFKFQKDFYNWETQLFTDSRYTPELVHELTKFSEDTLAHFMYSYPIAYDYARTATELELKMWIRTNYKEYIKGERYKDIPRIKDSLLSTPQH
jgi:hypothetical protein